MISVVVLTRNSENRIEKCIRSLAWCDEIIVIDDLSTDGTIKKINSLHLKQLKIFTHPLENDFATQHNFGIKNAAGDWVLFIDDDEIVSSKLAEEIKRAIQTNKYDGYLIPRRDFFFGKFLRFGETSSVKFLRFARKNSGIWERKVHEIWKISGKTGQLKNPIDHFPHPSISEFITSINQYTTIDAKELNKEGKEFSYFKVLIYPPGKFFQNYFLNLGFLDGFPGFVMAFMMSLHSLIVRVKQYDFSTSS